MTILVGVCIKRCGFNACIGMFFRRGSFRGCKAADSSCARVCKKVYSKTNKKDTGAGYCESPGKENLLIIQ